MVRIGTARVEAELAKTKQEGGVSELKPYVNVSSVDQFRLAVSNDCGWKKEKLRQSL